MKKTIAILALLALACFMVFAGGDDEKSSTPASSGEKITLTVWGSQEDQAMLKEMCNAYAAANPDKSYKFLYGVQSESDAADKVLNDPESGPDVFAFASDQINKLIQAGALARVGGSILDNIKSVNTPGSMDAATVTQRTSRASTECSKSQRHPESRSLSSCMTTDGTFPRSSSQTRSSTTRSPIPTTSPRARSTSTTTARTDLKS